MSAVLLDGGIVHYEVIGRGRPIIFLHGWVGSWRYWISAMQTASTSFRAYAVDMWGFGDSARDVSQYALERQMGLLEKFMEQMGIGKVALVGHGLGGVVAMMYANRNPQTVDRLMVIDCPLEFNAVNSRLRSDPLPNLIDWLLKPSPDAEPARADAAKADQQAIATSFTDQEIFNKAVRPSVTMPPCLLVYGEKDPAIIPPPNGGQTLPIQFHTIQLEQSGHFPMIDEPARFNRLLTDFMALDSGESPRDLQLKEEWKRRVR
jgi:pimeloyl-ACP methyl ester carboxylesterase